MFTFLKKLCGWGTRTISSSQAKKFTEYLKTSQKLDVTHQIIEYDKIYHNILKSLGYEGTFGEILKKNPKEIRNIQEIWELHKFRNTLVHELRDLDERFVLKQGKRYKLIVETFIQQVTK